MKELQTHGHELSPVANLLDDFPAGVGFPGGTVQITPVELVSKVKVDRRSMPLSFFF